MNNILPRKFQILNDDEERLPMPPDVPAIARKFIPNNPKLVQQIVRVCDHVFRARVLPPQLVKLLVDRGFELTHRTGMDLESKILEDKLIEYAQILRPRFLAKINEMQRQKRKWS